MGSIFGRVGIRGIIFSAVMAVKLINEMVGGNVICKSREIEF
jgi:hypothetical protein